VFISFAEADRAWVEGYLLDALERAGVDCYSEAQFALGEPRLRQFEQAVTGSKRTLLVLSPAYFADDWSRVPEILAQSYGFDTSTWPVIPLVLEEVELPPSLAMLTRLDATDPATYPQVIDRLYRDLQRPLPPPAAQPACPYPGMSPFREDDSARFYGREKEVEQILHRLRLHPFLAVIGPSGSGKSSVVHAGVVPALRRSGLFGDGDWSIRSVRLGNAPVEALAAALSRDPEEAFPPGHWGFVIDQFEEVFTTPGVDLGPFYATLDRLFQMPNTYVLLVARADFYGQLMQTPIWQAIQSHRFELLPLDEAGLRRAIVGPAESEGVRVYVEAALVERLVADAAREPGALPLIQETLVLLWEHLERRFLPLRAYAALVLSRSAYDRPGQGKRSGLEVAIEQRAEAALAELETPRRQAIARRMFVQLVQFGEGRPDTRRQQTIAELADEHDAAEDFGRTLETLTRNRLITLNGNQNDGRAVVDLSHEALIAGWPRFQEWLQQGREDLIRGRRLRASTIDWTAHARDEGLLYAGARLSEARSYAQRHPRELLPDEEAFLAASDANEVRRERSHYLGQAGGGAVGTGFGYGGAFALGFLDPNNAPNAALLAASTFLFLLGAGQVTGLGIGLSLWLTRRRPIIRVLVSVLVGGCLSALMYCLFLQFATIGQLTIDKAAAGACIGIGSAAGVAAAWSRWQRLAFTTVGGLLGILAAVAIGNIVWVWPVRIAAGLAFGVLSGAGFWLTYVDDQLQPTQETYV
jgi:hypothetical protein